MAWAFNTYGNRWVLRDLGVGVMSNFGVIKREVTPIGYSVSVGVVTLEGKEVAFGFNLDEYDHNDTEVITKHPDLFEFPEDEAIFGTEGVWVKQGVQGKISIAEWISIVNSTSNCELYDIGKKKVLAGGMDGISQMYDEDGTLDMEEIPAVSPGFLMEQISIKYPEYAAALREAGLYEQCKTNLGNIDPKVRKAIEDYVFCGNLTKFKVGEFSSDRLMEEWRESPLDMYWSIGWLMQDYEKAKEKLLAEKPALK